MSRINLHYIRAAIESGTGKHLSLEDTRDLLVDEGLITTLQAEQDATIFYGYGDYYSVDTVQSEPRNDLEPRELRFI